MSTEELKQDFESARIKHVHFKSKLRSYLFGNGGETGPLRDPEQCGLGRWIAERLRGQGAYAHLPEARQFDQKHIRIHLEANRLMDLHDAGKDDEVSSRYTPLQQLADEMVVLLQTMEAKLRTEA
ncbi:CZB domain-containing protein [Hymenobacter sp. UYCo722]|uniref:CZB domain-containing protein n=1 Tax=Hymenobacter sp. UYCo722 TaxID=3156335 RepID=UPI003392CBEA